MNEEPQKFDDGSYVYTLHIDGPGLKCEALLSVTGALRAIQQLIPIDKSKPKRKESK